MPSRRYHIHLDIDSFVENTRFPSGYKNMLVTSDGHNLSPAEARSFLLIEKAKGRKVIPCSSECGSPCEHEGCTGFYYQGGGCPGHPIKEIEIKG